MLPTSAALPIGEGSEHGVYLSFWKGIGTGKTSVPVFFCHFFLPERIDNFAPLVLQ